MSHVVCRSVYTCYSGARWGGERGGSNSRKLSKALTAVSRRLQRRPRPGRGGCSVVAHRGRPCVPKRTGFPPLSSKPGGFHRCRLCLTREGSSDESGRRFLGRLGLQCWCWGWCQCWCWCCVVVVCVKGALHGCSPPTQMMQYIPLTATICPPPVSPRLPTSVACSPRPRTLSRTHTHIHAHSLAHTRAHTHPLSLRCLLLPFTGDDCCCFEPRRHCAPPVCPTYPSLAALTCRPLADGR